MSAYRKQTVESIEAPDTLETQLLAVQRAIRAIETGAQEYQIGNRRISRADLKSLYDRELQLKRAIASELAGGGLIVGYAETGTN